jgi:MinD-like ATPase involved in chromosome partitioning or flagellar assembly
MSEPEVALVFTPEPWVEELHRHLSDHGGARVRSLVVEPAAARDEHYDVLVVGHRWAALTRALVDELHARGRSVVGVYDREEPAGRSHLSELGVDAVVESDAAPSTFVAVISATAGRRDDVAGTIAEAPRRHAHVVVVGGPPGAGRTEVAVQLALAVGRARSVVLIDADDVAPAVAQRLALGLEPNLRTAIEAVEHRRADVAASVVLEPVTNLAVLPGLPNVAGWSQVRPGEVVRVIDELADHVDVLVVDGAGLLEDVGSGGRSRFAIGRALLAEADLVVSVCDASPVGVARLLSWTAEAVQIAAGTPLVAVVNRSPASRFRRGEVFEELMTSAPFERVVFVPSDARVTAGAWNGTAVRRGPFTRALEPLAAVAGAAAGMSDGDRVQSAS